MANVSARLLMKGDINLVFEGSIDSDGMCTIPVSKLKNLFKEQASGKAILEVIADDTYFKPWEDEYIIKTAKKVTAEVIQSKPIVERKIEVKIQPQITTKEVKLVEDTKKSNIKPIPTHSKSIASILRKKGITYENALSNKQMIGGVVGSYIKENNLDIPISKLLKETLEYIK
jgi:hypothetical protein